MGMPCENMDLYRNFLKSQEKYMKISICFLNNDIGTSGTHDNNYRFLVFINLLPHILVKKVVRFSQMRQRKFLPPRKDEKQFSITLERLG
jgi:hypothetical protein